MTNVTRAVGRTSVLVICRYSEAEPDLERRLRDLYGPWFGAGCIVTLRRLPHLSTTIALVHDKPELTEISDLFVWGDAIGIRGVATEQELLAATSGPRWGRDLLGSFVAVRVSDAAVAVVVTPDLVHTLRTVNGPRGQVWATHGLAAVMASGTKPRIAIERIPEFILLDYVFADDELLEGVRVLPEATVVEIDANSVRETDYWPVADRLLSAHDVTAADLREAIRAGLDRISRRNRLELALTAGRDSTLLASCLKQMGRDVATFTFGDESTPDGVGASAVAASLGWEHRFVVSRPGGSASIERLLRATRWTDGLDTAANSYPPRLAHSHPEGAVHMYGIGGEMGRAFYWSKYRDHPLLLEDPGFVLTEWRARHLTPQAREMLLGRARGFADRLQNEGWLGTGVYDGWHARGRVRKWPAHIAQPIGLESLCTVYTSPSIARTLLGIPVHKRVGSVTFDEANRIGHDLYAVARSAAANLPAPVTPKKPPLARTKPHPWLRLANRARKDLGSKGPVAEAMGSKWWDDTSRLTVGSEMHPNWLWNALAVDALGSVIEDLT